MKALQLIAAGGALPCRTVTNEDLSRLVDTSDEWIASRTGIRRRHFCGEGESCTALAVSAARQALQRSGLPAQAIGCCVCATLSGDHATPSTACLVQQALDLPEDIPVLDVNAACSGFVYGAAVARGLLAQTGGRYALVVGCEQLSRLLDMTDRSTCVLFGDGAGAAVFELVPAADAPFAVTLICFFSSGAKAPPTTAFLQMRLFSPRMAWRTMAPGSMTTPGITTLSSTTASSPTVQPTEMMEWVILP